MLYNYSIYFFLNIQTSFLWENNQVLFQVNAECHSNSGIKQIYWSNFWLHCQQKMPKIILPKQTILVKYPLVKNIFQKKKKVSICKEQF